MSDVKKPKSSLLLYLLAIVTVLVLLCTATILYLVASSRVVEPKPENSTSSQLFLVPEPTALSSTSSTSVSETTTSSSKDDATPVGTTPSTTSAAPPTVASTARSIDDATTVTSPTTTTTTATTTLLEYTTTTSDPETTTITTAEPETMQTTTLETTPETTTWSYTDRNAEVIEKCSSVVAEPVTCPKTRDDVVTLKPSAFSPLHYALNLSVQSVMPTVLEGDVQIYIRMNTDAKQVTLDVDNELRHVDHIHVVNCDTGVTLCVAKTVFDQRDRRLSLILFDGVEAGTNIRVDILKFTSVNNRDVTYAQIAPRWNRNAPVMVGTLLTAGSAMKIFPAIDSPAHKASVDLCVRFNPKGHVRSNAPLKSLGEGLTCFARTFPVSTQQIGFAAFEKAETLIYNATVLDGVYIPSVEIVFSLNRNFKREKHEWIYNETSKVVSKMTRWTSFPYPLESLKLVSAPIRASSHSTLGLVTLQDRLVEHPSYTLAHVSLIHSVIQQWISGIVSMSNADESCFAESLTTYLEWKLNEELGIVNKTRAGEVEAIRPKDLSTEGRDEPRILRSLETMQSCPERFVSIFYTIDETFGQETITRMLEIMFRKFAYSTTSISDWQQAVVDASGNSHSGQLLFEWFSRKTRPVLCLHVSSQSLQFEQISDELWTIPVEIAGSSGVQLVTITENSTMVPYSSHDYVIADPRRKSSAVIVQDVNSYIRLIRCWDDSRCPASQTAVRGIIRDLAAVFLTNKLAKPTVQDIPKWKAVFQFAQHHRILDSNAACCAQYAISRTADIACTWVIRDTCEKITLINTVAAGV